MFNVSVLYFNVVGCGSGYACNFEERYPEMAQKSLSGNGMNSGICGRLEVAEKEKEKHWQVMATNVSKPGR